jgi:hypothetical protein
MHDKVKERALSNQVLTPELQAEVDSMLSSYYCKQYERMFSNYIDKLLH